MTNYRLFAFTKEESSLLSQAATAAAQHADGQPANQLYSLALSKLSQYLGSGGFLAYTGCVTDQDGDAGWQLTSSLEHIRRWADDMSVVSFEVPRTYRICVTRSGFGIAHQLKTKPSAQRSKLHI